MYILNEIIDDVISRLSEQYSLEIAKRDVWLSNDFYFNRKGVFCFVSTNKNLLDFLEKLNAPHYMEIKKVFDSKRISLLRLETSRIHPKKPFTDYNNYSIDFTVHDTTGEIVDLNENFKYLVETRNFVRDWYSGICGEENIFKKTADFHMQCSGVFSNSENISLSNGKVIIEDITEMTISDIIDSKIDPEMNIEKVVEMINDSYDVTNTKEEAQNLIQVFTKNFNNEYMIIRKNI